MVNRNSRHKARIKFLIQKIGIDAFNELVVEEQLALTHQRYKVDVEEYSRKVGKTESPQNTFFYSFRLPDLGLPDPFRYQLWKTTNVFAQSNQGYFAVYVRVANGNIGSHTSRRLIEKLKDVIADDVRVHY
jgi:sulfite reductase (ferredoxin)